VTTLQAYIAGIGLGRAVADCMRGAEASSASLSGRRPPIWSETGGEFV